MRRGKEGQEVLFHGIIKGRWTGWSHNPVRKSKSDGRNYQCKKEAGMTSHDVVFKLRKILGTKKIGHGERWIRMWVGVLPIAVGKATRMVEFMQDEGKGL